MNKIICIICETEIFSIEKHLLKHNMEIADYEKKIEVEYDKNLKEIEERYREVIDTVYDIEDIDTIIQVMQTLKNDEIKQLSDLFRTYGRK